MKRLYLFVLFCMQVFVVSAAQTGSSLDAYRSNSEAMFRCMWVAAGSEDTQEEKKKNDTDDEEEPDCD